MKEIKLEQLPEDVGRLVGENHEGRMVLTRGGQPVAILTPVDHLDAEDLGYMESPEFWEMIAKRRHQNRVPLSAAFARLEQREAKEAKSK